MQNLQWTRPLSVRRAFGESLVIVGAIYEQATPAGNFPYINCYNAYTGVPYLGVEVEGPIPTPGQRGMLHHAEGDPNTLIFRAISAPSVEWYVPLLSWLTTLSASGVPEGVVGYAFPGQVSTLWSVEVVGVGSGSVTVGAVTILLTETWTRQRQALTPAPSAGTLLTPTVTVPSAGTVTLSQIQLVAESYIVPEGGSA